MTEEQIQKRKEERFQEYQDFLKEYEKNQDDPLVRDIVNIIGRSFDSFLNVVESTGIENARNSVTSLIGLPVMDILKTIKKHQ